MASIDGKARFVQTLQRAMESSRAVAVYSDPEDFDSYEVGFVEHVDREELILTCLTPKGEPDGRRSIRTDDVCRIAADTAYTKKLQLLYEYRESVFDRDFRPAPAGAQGLRPQLEHAKEQHTLVHVVDANDYGPSGFVETLGDDFVDILRIGPNVEPDGVATILLSSVSKIHFGRRKEQVLEFLYRYHFELKKLLE